MTTLHDKCESMLLHHSLTPPHPRPCSLLGPHYSCFPLCYPPVTHLTRYLMHIDCTITALLGEFSRAAFFRNGGLAVAKLADVFGGSHHW